MKPIKILYWSQITLDNVSFTPVFFFNPSLEILSYLGRFGYLNIPITISGTNGLYDGSTFVNIDRSTTPKPCPMDMDDSPIIYSATLINTSFNIYPYKPFIGEFIISNHKSIDNIQQEKKIEEIEKALKEPYSKDTTKQNSVISIDGIPDFNKNITLKGKSPLNAAPKTLTIVAKNYLIPNNYSTNVHLQEITPHSSNKIYSYVVTREKLNNPITISCGCCDDKEINFHYKNSAKKL